MTNTAIASNSHSTDAFLDESVLSAILHEIHEDASLRRTSAPHTPPTRAITLIKQHRLGAARLPVEEGGGGYSIRDLLELVIALGRADPDVPHILRAHFSIVEELMYRRAGGAGPAPLLAEIAQGVLVGSAASELSSAPVGSNRFDTSLTPETGTWRLNGEKFYCTGAKYSDLLRVRVAVPSRDGATADVLIPTHRDGIDHVDDWDGIGQIHTGSGTTRFTDVHVSSDEILFEWTSADFTVPRQGLTQIYLHAVAAGVLDDLTADASELVRQRPRAYTFAAADQPRNDPQLLQVVGSIASVAYAARALVLNTADTLDLAAAPALRGTPDAHLEDQASISAAKAKIAIEDLSLKAAADIYNIGGASAVRGRTGLDRHWRNLRTLFSHNPTVYKARVIGDVLVNDASLPSSGFF